MFSYSGGLLAQAVYNAGHPLARLRVAFLLVALNILAPLQDQDLNCEFNLVVTALLCREGRAFQSGFCLALFAPRLELILLGREFNKYSVGATVAARIFCQLSVHFFPMILIS